MARQVTIEVVVDVDDSEDLARDVADSMWFALMEDPQRAFPYTVNSLDVTDETEDDNG